MSPLVPVVITITVGILAGIIFAGDTVVELIDIRNDAAEVSQTRNQENLRGTYQGSATNIEEMKIQSKWTDASIITAIVVKCDDGTVHTIRLNKTNYTIPGGSIINITSSLISDIESKTASC